MQKLWHPLDSRVNEQLRVEAPEIPKRLPSRGNSLVSTEGSYENYKILGGMFALHHGFLRIAAWESAAWE
jgi:hypothetical protein